MAGLRSVWRALLPLVAVLCLQRSILAEQAHPDLAKCINEESSAQSTTYEDFIQGKPTRLRLHAAWWSDKRPPVPLTIVTGLTVSRLDQLEAQCASWRGPLSAAVYLVLHEPAVRGTSSTRRLHGVPDVTDPHKKVLADAAAALDAFHKKMEVRDGCALDMMLLYEVVADELMTLLLPINTMRNYALLQARTKLVSMVDVDLLVSQSLFDWMLDDKSADYVKRECSQKKVFVLPAFETALQKDMEVAHRIAGDAVGLDKKGLSGMVGKRLVHQFALYLFREGHMTTEYNKWFSTDTAYPVGWQKDYEPWFVVDRFLNPFYDSVFRGYGWNKVTHVTAVYASKFQFMVHPAGFLVHRQHSRSGADKLYQTQKKVYEDAVKKNKVEGEAQTSLAALTHRFRNRVLSELADGHYKPSVDDGLQRCVKMLPWWQKPDAGSSDYETYDP